MMLLSRFWYAVLAILLSLALYVVYVAVGQYNRRNAVAMNEGLASDSQTVGWALQIDARRRLDLLLPGSVDPTVRSSLAAANGKDMEKVPQKAKDDARKALGDIQGKFSDYRPDAIFAVDRDGRVIAQVGYDAVSSNDHFELGGYPAVFDALHGYLRDDTWVWGGKIYRVVARPVEDDATQPPVGAIVALRGIDAQFARDMAKRTRTNVAFYAAGQRLASAAYEGAGEKFDDASFELIGQDMVRLGDDKTYHDSGRSDVHALGPDAGIGAMYARLPGDAWDLGAGFSVLRPRVAIKGPLGFLSGADDTDKKSVSWAVLILVVLFGTAAGIGFSFLEHTMPMGELTSQARRMKKGEIDYLQLPRFRGGYRPIAQDLNAGIERIAERGGAGRKPADLESILGPVPAQPAMSAFSFPLPPDGGPIPPVPPAGGPSTTGRNQVPPVAPGPRGPGGPPMNAQNANPAGPPPPFRPPGPPAPGGPGPRPPGPNNFGGPGGPNNNFRGGPPDPFRGGPSAGDRQQPPGGPRPPGAGPFPPPRPGGLPATSPFAQTTAQPSPLRDPHPADAYEPTQAAPSPVAAVPQMQPIDGAPEEDEATMVGQVPADVLAQATGAEQQKAEDGSDEWLGVYDDFIRKKRECGEPTDGLTFEKFAQTLKKNRDALMQRHGCKRVRFAVYVKEGRASLKATPIKD
jgi:CHASE4 domain